ncbi:MAG: aldo/keto reductase [Spirochaetaceae bacterium]|jgi:diketogulonate reductase-like aldo/keto reductase|nr:aldo/keto reductase [Spirochaetaceae bacterium]
MDFRSLVDPFTLSNGVKIPCIGFGTWQTPDGEVAVSSVKAALKAGYRHIDTAAIYGNEESIGRAIKESGVPRKDIFLTTKLWNDDHGYDAALRAFEASARKLKTDYFDLYLIHWPNPARFRGNWQQVNADTWRAFEELYQAGKVRAIGLSNFHERHIEPLLKTASVVPQVNQIRLCPGNTQDAVVAYCRGKNMLLEAYSPLGVGQLIGSPEIKTFADKYHRSPAQICIRWSLQRGYLPLPKSITPERIDANTRVFDFELSPDDVEKIAGLTGIGGLDQNPDETSF